MSTINEDIQWARDTVGNGYYSICEHANIRMNERDISDENIEDVVKEGVASTTKRGRLCFEKDEIKVIVKVMKFRISIITVIRKGEDEEC